MNSSQEIPALQLYEKRLDLNPGWVAPPMSVAGQLFSQNMYATRSIFPEIDLYLHFYKFQ